MDTFKRRFLCRSHTFVFGSLRLCVKDWKFPQQNKQRTRAHAEAIKNQEERKKLRR